MLGSNIEAEGTPAGDTDAPGQGQPTQSTVDEESITDLLTEPLTQTYVKAIVTLYALLGAGRGLLVIVGDIVDQALIDAPGDNGALVELGLYQIPLVGAPHIAAVLGLFVGGYLAVRMVADDRQTMITAAAGAVAGTVLLWFLSAILAASQLDSINLEIGGLLVNSIILGLFVGAIAAGTVYVVRNLVPDVDSPAV